MDSLDRRGFHQITASIFMRLVLAGAFPGVLVLVGQSRGTARGRFEMLTAPTPTSSSSLDALGARHPRLEDHIRDVCEPRKSRTRRRPRSMAVRSLTLGPGSRIRAEQPRNTKPPAAKGAKPLRNRADPVPRIDEFGGHVHAPRSSGRFDLAASVSSLIDATRSARAFRPDHIGHRSGAAGLAARTTSED